MLNVQPGSTALDVGSGTGVVAAILAAAVGPAGRVVASDPSAAMLRVAAQQPSIQRVAARAPGLPFPDAVFDTATASFVISHIADYADGLAELIRVCRTGGRIGVTAWGTLPNPAGALWKQVASTIEGSERLADAFSRAIPWDEWFSRAANLERALRDTHMTGVAVVTRQFVVSVAVDDYIAMKGASVEGTLLRRLLSAESWERFAREVTTAFRTRFGPTVEFVRDFHIGIGTAPRRT